MTEKASAALRALVQCRANYRCEYCLLHEADSGLPYEADHVVACKHGGETAEKNLAWTCFNCNRHKGTDLASIDPRTRKIVPLFNPRRHKWSAHFRLEGARIVPLTPQGRVTVFLLQLNRFDRLDVREDLICSERYPGKAP